MTVRRDVASLVDRTQGSVYSVQAESSAAEARTTRQEAEARAKAVEAVVGAAAVGARPSLAAAVAAGTMVTVGPASGGTDDPFKAGRVAAAARLPGAMVVGVQGRPRATPGTGQPRGGQTQAQTQ